MNRTLRAALLVFAVLSLGCSAGASLSDDEIMEGDLPPGPPFDGTSGRASMFNLDQMAKAAYAALVGGTTAPERARQPVTKALIAAGYGGGRVLVTQDFTAQDRSCSPDNRIETRLRFSPDGDALEVVVASAVWVSAITYQPRDGAAVLVTPAGDCVTR